MRDGAHEHAILMWFLPPFAVTVDTDLHLPPAAADASFLSTYPLSIPRLVLDEHTAHPACEHDTQKNQQNRQRVLQQRSPHEVERTAAATGTGGVAADSRLGAGTAGLVIQNGHAR